MVEFAYKYFKNKGINYTSFKLDCGCYFYLTYKKDIDPCFKSKLDDEL